MAAQNPGSKIEQTFQTSKGARRVDVLTPQNIALESKVGRTSFDKRIESEVAKDKELIDTGQVNGVEWVFSRSATTGRIGPSSKLEEELTKAGITWRLTP